ncbi:MULTISPECIES: hypothetical protein [pseudomallei group]|uniref:hypothetical protein n=1 Tax=pseudomallei group TaxID=111527 RepID=UPI00358DBEE4
MRGSTRRSDPIRHSMACVNSRLYVFGGHNEKTYNNASCVAGHSCKGLSVGVYVILSLYVFGVH